MRLELQEVTAWDFSAERRIRRRKRKPSSRRLARTRRLSRGGTCRKTWAIRRRRPTSVTPVAAGLTTSRPDSSWSARRFRSHSFCDEHSSRAQLPHIAAGLFYPAYPEVSKD